MLGRSQTGSAKNLDRPSSALEGALQVIAHLHRLGVIVLIFKSGGVRVCNVNGSIQQSQLTAAKRRRQSGGGSGGGGGGVSGSGGGGGHGGGHGGHGSAGGGNGGSGGVSGSGGDGGGGESGCESGGESDREQLSYRIERLPKFTPRPHLPVRDRPGGNIGRHLISTRAMLRLAGNMKVRARDVQDNRGLRSKWQAQSPPLAARETHVSIAVVEAASSHAQSLRGKGLICFDSVRCAARVHYLCESFSGKRSMACSSRFAALRPTAICLKV